jgi:hypothetical protein
MSKSVILDNNLTPQTSNQDRRAVKNLSLYITELPPTPLPQWSSRLRGKKNHSYRKRASATTGAEYFAPKQVTKRGAQSVVDSVEVPSQTLPLRQDARDEPSSSDSEESVVYETNEEQHEYSRPVKQRFRFAAALARPKVILDPQVTLAARHDRAYRVANKKRLSSQMEHDNGNIEDGDDERTPLVLAKRLPQSRRSGRPRNVNGNRPSAC